MAVAVYSAVAHAAYLPDASFYGESWEMGQKDGDAPDWTNVYAAPKSKKSASAKSLSRAPSAALTMTRVSLESYSPETSIDSEDEQYDLMLPGGDPKRPTDLIRIMKPKLITSVRYDDECESV
jgi:hypothetical protein